MTATLTGRQRQILTFIAACVKRRGYPPTIREIGTEVGLSSPASVQYQLRQLQNAGAIRVNPGPRAITIIDEKGTGDGA